MIVPLPLRTPNDGSPLFFGLVTRICAIVGLASLVVFQGLDGIHSSCKRKGVALIARGVAEQPNLANVISLAFTRSFPRKEDVNLMKAFGNEHASQLDGCLNGLKCVFQSSYLLVNLDYAHTCLPHTQLAERFGCPRIFAIQHPPPPNYMLSATQGKKKEHITPPMKTKAIVSLGIRYRS